METINNWAPETRSLLRALRAAGFTIVEGDNGEDKFKFDGDEAKFIANLTACDESHLYVVDPSGARRWLYLVYGNNPGELVSDYSLPREGTDYLDAVTTAHYDKWEGRKQPKTQRESVRERIAREEAEGV